MLIAEPAAKACNPPEAAPVAELGEDVLRFVEPLFTLLLVPRQERGPSPGLQCPGLAATVAYLPEGQQSGFEIAFGAPGVPRQDVGHPSQAEGLCLASRIAESAPLIEGPAERLDRTVELALLLLDVSQDGEGLGQLLGGGRVLGGGARNHLQVCPRPARSRRAARAPAR